MLLERAFLTRDELLFKVLRNLSQQADLAIKAGFLLYMDQLAQLLQVWYQFRCHYPNLPVQISEELLPHMKQGAELLQVWYQFSCHYPSMPVHVGDDVREREQPGSAG